MSGEQCVHGGAAAHGRLVDVLAGAVGDVQAAAAVGEGWDAELGVPARLEHAGAQSESRAGGFDGLDAPGQRPGRGMVLVGAGGGLRLEHVDVDLRAGGLRRFLDHVRQPRELLVELFLGIEAPVDGEPRRAGHDVEAGAGTGLSADHQHRARRLVALHREARALVEQLAGERGQRLGDADQVLEGVDALVDVPDMRLAAGRLDPQREGPPARVPDPPAGRLGGEHRDRPRIDQVSLAQVPGTGRAAGLLVADEVKNDLASVEQAKLSGGGGAVEHRDQAALHVRGPAPDDLPVAALRLELFGALCRNHVEVPVVVDELRAAADAAAHDGRFLEAPCRRKLDHLRREAQPLHRVAKHARAAPELAAGWVLGGDTHERLEQRRRLLGPVVEPRLYLGAAVCHAPGARYWTCSAWRRASIVSSTVRSTVVSKELSAPPPLIANATAAIDTLSGASQRLYPSCSPNAYQNPWSFPPTDSMYASAAFRRSSGLAIRRPQVSGV